MKLFVLLSIFATFTQASEWLKYKTDECLSHARAHEDRHYANTEFFRCEDQSVSFQQPESSKWEGRCGHTMAANMLYTVCRKAVHPVAGFGDVLSDMGSGTTPSTVTSGLNIVFGKNRNICPPKSQVSWWYIKLGNAKNYIKTIKSYLKPIYSTKRMNTIKRGGRTYYRNPIGAMIKNPDGGLHWVTIVDYVYIGNVCHFKANHWGRQYTVPCTTLAEWAGKTRSVFPFFMSNYTVVVLKD